MKYLLLCIALCAAPVSLAAETAVGVLQVGTQSDGLQNETVVAMQDVFVSELGRTGLRAVKVQKRSQDLDAAKAIAMGQDLKVDFLVTSSVTEYGNTDSKVTEYGVTDKGVVSAKVYDASTGKSIWSGEERFDKKKDASEKEILDQQVKPSIRKLADRIKAGVPRN